MKLVQSPNSSITVIPAILTGITVVSGLVLTSTYVSAENNTSVVDEINVTVPVSCSIEGTGMTSHNADIANGNYTPDIGSTTMHVFCNDNNGFAIYAAGYTGDEVGGTNSNKLVGTAASGNATIESGLATTAGTPDVSNWAMKLAVTQDSGDTTTDNAFVIDSAPNVALPSEADSSATAASFSEYHIVPNEYVKVAHKNSMTDMTESTGGVKLTSTYAAYISKTQAADTYSGKVIYTLVHPADGLAPGSQLTMQNVATWGDTVAAGQEVEAVDARDGKVYTVARLADGNLWMTQNLDHDIDATKTYTPADTDIPTNWTPSVSTYATSNTTWSSNSYTAPESYDPGDLYWSGTADDSTPVSTGNSHYHLGNYYNWTAAMAMSDSSSYTTNQTLIDQSICPAGWTLPRVGSGEDTFYSLWSEYGYDGNYGGFSDISTLTGSPAYFALTGFWGGSFGGVGVGGYYWSPVVNGSDFAYSPYFSMYGDANLSRNDYRNDGRSIRCIARPVTSTLQW